jgi:hypothetical protein
MKRFLAALFLSLLLLRGASAQQEWNYTPPGTWGSAGISANSIVLGSPTGGNKGTGTINATGIFQNGTSIGSGPFLPLAGGTMAGPIVLNPAAPWSGTALTQTPINTGNVPITWTGTTGNSGGTIALGLYFNFGTEIDAHLNSGGVAGAVVNTEYYTGAQGGLTGIVDTVNIPSGQTIADTVPREFVSGRDFATAASATGVAHSLLGRTIVSQLLSGATGYGGNTGLEVAISSASGTAPGNVSNAYFMRYAADVARGTTDRMLGFWTQYAQTSGRGSPTTIDIGPQGQLGLYFPTPPDGTVMKASLGASDSSVTVASILDFSAITTVTNYDILMPNFSLSGGGSATLVSLYAGLAGGDFIGLSGAAAATADAVGITASGADTLISIVYVSKGGGFHKFFAGTSELFDVAAVASAISRIVVTPAASGNVLLDVAGTATGITIGGTTATGITLGKSAFAPNAPGGITLGTAGSAVGSATFLNATSGSVVLSPPTGALGTKTLTLPDVTDTFAVLATAQTFSATETFADAGTWGSAGISGTTINNSAIGGTTAAAAKFTTLAASSTVTFGSSTTGSTAQTYTNGPCTTSATTAQWIPIAITGQSGTWYVPACH